MQFAYYDEAGDDGFPQYSSEFFVLSALYFPYQRWHETFDAIRDLRRELKRDFGLPVKTEFHTKKFVLDKRPYRALGLSPSDRVAVLDRLCEFVGTLDVRIVNVCIVKPRIYSPGYPVLDTALKYSIQRIENDLNPRQNPDARFVLVTDEGRVGKMRKTARRIQRVNYIPSMFNPGQAYRREIESLIEDPLPKNSRESYFIQLADLVAFVVYQYTTVETGLATFHGRMPTEVDDAKVRAWMELLEPSLNTSAAAGDRFGVKFHPSGGP